MKKGKKKEKKKKKEEEELKEKDINNSKKKKEEEKIFRRLLCECVGLFKGMHVFLLNWPLMMPIPQNPYGPCEQVRVMSFSWLAPYFCWLCAIFLFFVQGQDDSFLCSMVSLSPNLTPARGNGTITLNVLCNVDNLEVFRTLVESLANIEVDFGAAGRERASIFSIEQGNLISITAR